MRAEINKRPEELCLKVFTHWLDTKSNPTWKKLIRSLGCQDVNLPRVASNIEKMLATVSYYCNTPKFSLLILFVS